MSKTAHNDVTGESIKSGAGGKGNAAESQSKFDAGWDLLWGNKEKAKKALADSQTQWVAAVEEARKALPEGYVESGILCGGTEKPLTRCASHQDGDCYHKDCPQLRDNEPKTSGRHCPLDTFDYED